jgi:multidrug resistance efflux pump
MTQTHEPDPRFLEHLEWQLLSDRRRRASFGEPTENLRKRRNIKMIGIVLCSVLTGAMATATTTHLQDVAQGRLYLAQAAVQLQLADSRLELSRKNLDYLKERTALGVVSPEESARAEADVARMEIERMRLALDYEEVEASHRQPRNELSAPLVDGRDFVTERLILDLKSREKTLMESEAEAKRMRRLAETGLVRSTELRSAKDAAEQVRFVIDDLQQKIQLRTSFLRGEISAEKMELMSLQTEAVRKVKTNEMIIDSLRDEYATAEKRHRLGVVSVGELDRARFRLESSEAALKLAKLELEIIQTNLNK